MNRYGIIAEGIIQSYDCKVVDIEFHNGWIRVLLVEPCEELNKALRKYKREDGKWVVEDAMSYYVCNPEIVTDIKSENNTDYIVLEEWATVSQVIHELEKLREVGYDAWLETNEGHLEIVAEYEELME